MKFLKTAIKNRISAELLFYYTLLRRQPALFLANILCQKLLRVDADCPYIKHYTSRVLMGKNIRIDRENPEKTLKSFFSSGGCYFQAEKGIEIGAGTFWSVNVVLASDSYDIATLGKKEIVNPIKIGKKCWLGANVVILPEVELGDRTIVGAGSVVTRSFLEGNCVIAGVPAKLIKKIEDLDENKRT